MIIYKVKKGNTFHQCAWLVVIPYKTKPDSVIAEFWDRKDALSFCAMKNGNPKYNYTAGYNAATKHSYAMSGR
jgi:hypothetical protein